MDPHQPLRNVLDSLCRVVESHDYHQYKAEHTSADSQQRLARLKRLLAASPYVSEQLADAQLLTLLFTQFAAKDVHRAYTLVNLAFLSSDHQLITDEPTYKHNYRSARGNEIRPSGMDNWSSVLCYFDSLLFAMFARTDDYDGSLLAALPDEDVKTAEFKLCLRLLVNLMRSGEATITTDLVQVVCAVFAELGFAEAISKKQQDVVTCFEMLCDILKVPLLTLKIDIIHSGKVDLDDDLKYMGERVLFISVPEDKINDLKTETIHEEDDASGSKLSFSKMVKTRLSKRDKDDTINLEECLNSYFNNTVKVKRVLERRRTLTVDAASGNLSPPVSRVSHPFSPQTSSNSTVVQDVSSASTSDSEDDESLADNDLLSAHDLKERNDFLGYVSYSTDIIQPVPVDGLKVAAQYGYGSGSTSGSTSGDGARSAQIATPSPSTSPLGAGSDDAAHVLFRRSVSSPIVAPNAPPPPLATPLAAPMRHRRRDSMSKINQIITATRSRSSTDASARSNPLIKRTNSTTLSHTPDGDIEVTLPAWMFLQLLPYYSDFGSDDTDDLKRHAGRPRLQSDDKATVEMVEMAGASADVPAPAPAPVAAPVAAHSPHPPNPIRKLYQDQRPIVPICLKRYIYNESGKTQKINKKFSIPTVIDLPYFVADDRPTQTNNAETNASFDRFRLVLESAVCHRGNSVDSGHYVAAARKHKFVAGKSKRAKEDEQIWLLFNDMKDGDDKVTEKTFKQILDTEAPYLLFYRIEDYDFDPLASGASASGASSIQKVDTAETATAANTAWLEKLSSGSGADLKELRKNSVISTLSQVSSVKKEDELRQISSVSSAAMSAAASTGASTLASTAASMAPPATLPATAASEQPAPDDAKSGARHQHHGFSFSRSLSRSSSRPPPVKRDQIGPDSLDFIDWSDRFYWYYRTADGSYAKQTKTDDTRTTFPFYGAMGAGKAQGDVWETTARVPPAIKSPNSSKESTASSATVSVAVPQLPLAAAAPAPAPAPAPQAALSPKSTKTVHTTSSAATPKKHHSKHRLGKRAHGKSKADDKCVIV